VPSHSRKIAPDFFNRITTLLNPENAKFQSHGINQLQAPAEEGFRNPAEYYSNTL
jgi:hypothetical protein